MAQCINLLLVYFSALQYILTFRLNHTFQPRSAVKSRVGINCSSSKPSNPNCRSIWSWSKHPLRTEDPNKYLPISSLPLAHLLQKYIELVSRSLMPVPGGSGVCIPYRKHVQANIYIFSIKGQGEASFVKHCGNTFTPGSSAGTLRAELYFTQ